MTSSPAVSATGASSGETETPKVGIGMPVYNGAELIGLAIESILAQTFTDFELVIVDNASTDDTVAIARHYAERDPRVTVHINESNIGAAPNFDRAFELTRGPYFKWAAHDDLMEPEFIERCVRVLDEDDGVVLAYPKAMIIDEVGADVEPYDLHLPTDSDDVVERFASLLRGHKCFEVFGLIRRDPLATTPGMGAYSHGDGVLLARLALLGRFVEVPRYDFRARRHAKQSMAMLGDYHQYAVWFDPRLKDKWVFPQWKIHWEFFKSIWRSRIGGRERRHCYKALAGWAWKRRRLLRGDVTYHIRRVLQKWTGWTLPGRATKKDS
ncbi:MAG: glycosyltransferase family 2 protein [Planctomycetes bacterium]|nr:glycosyltransferase family 2 protein [Planctomycetota bacterium]